MSARALLLSSFFIFAGSVAAAPVCAQVGVPDTSSFRSPDFDPSGNYGDYYGAEYGDDVVGPTRPMGVTEPQTTVGMSAKAGAQQAPPGAKRVDLGKQEYQSSCAVCHGLNGKGDGPFSRYTEKSVVADLTAIAKKNDGLFPFRRVYQTIDGTKLRGARGNRDMPIWGTRYRVDVTKQLSYDPEVFARSRILALTEYVYRLQIPDLRKDDQFDSRPDQMQAK